MDNIETKWLYDFITLEETRNFSHAAIKRNVSQPAFSRRIQTLEAAVGVALFERGTTPLQLTLQGKVFHSQVRHLLQQLENNLTQLRGGKEFIQNNIKVAAAHSLSLGIFPDLVKTISSRFTYSVEVIDVDEAVGLLREGKKDFIFSYRDENLLQTPFEYIKIFESELYPVCATDEKGQPLYSLYQDEFPLLNYTDESYMGRLVNRMLTKNSEIHFKTVFVSSMSELLKMVVLNGAGIAWLPHYSIEKALKEKTLVCLGGPQHAIPISAYAYRLDSRMNEQMECFWRELKERFK